MKIISAKANESVMKAAWRNGGNGENGRRNGGNRQAAAWRQPQWRHGVAAAYQRQRANQVSIIRK
jgi:hypothetical protein